MPRSYSEQEREYIKKRLKEEAASCMAQFGIRRTTVDEIVRRVKIPKGTFYLFYKSKELLLFDVLLEQHEIVSQKLFQTVSKIDPYSLTTEKLTDIILQFFRLSEAMPILKVLNSGEVELLARKLPDSTVNEHFGHDSEIVNRLLTMLPIKTELDAEAISAVFHAIYFITLHKNEIGETQYENTLRTLIYGVVSQII